MVTVYGEVVTAYAFINSMILIFAAIIMAVTVWKMEVYEKYNRAVYRCGGSDNCWSCIFCFYWDRCYSLSGNNQSFVWWNDVSLSLRWGRRMVLKYEINTWNFIVSCSYGNYFLDFYRFYYDEYQCFKSQWKGTIYSTYDWNLWKEWRKSSIR